MVYLYNVLQFLALPLLLCFAVFGFCSAKYRDRLTARLGIGLGRQVPEKKKGIPRIWIHALSVGEVRSASVLLHALGKHMPNAELVLSSTTRTGLAAAREQGKPICCLLSYPLDLWFSVRRFLDLVEPDLFVLVETDFWPNLLWQLQRRQIPAILVNGRISKKSWRGYHAGAFFFRALFSMFARIYMQTEEDANRMRQLGVSVKRVDAAGNLKYDAALLASSFLSVSANRQETESGSFLIVAGSTHAGEEEMLLAAFEQLWRQWPDCRLVIAPRDIGRSKAIAELAERAGFSYGYCSREENAGATVRILDRYGLLMQCYRIAEIVFIGGSLVNEGGHNPLEAAVFARPILFGPHMDDFQEIERDLSAAGAALTVTNQTDLQEALFALRSNARQRKEMAQRAAAVVSARSGCAERIANEIERILQERKQPFFKQAASVHGSD